MTKHLNNEQDAALRAVREKLDGLKSPGLAEYIIGDSPMLQSVFEEYERQEREAAQRGLLARFWYRIRHFRVDAR